jgi:hypothetical protein
VALVAIGGGVWWFTSGGGSSSLSDDGPHKLTTPATVLGGDYQRMGENQEPEDASSGDARDLAAGGITDAKSVESKAITFLGLFGKVEDPEDALDTAFADINKDPDSDMKLIGDPRSVSPTTWTVP